MNKSLFIGGSKEKRKERPNFSFHYEKDRAPLAPLAPTHIKFFFYYFLLRFYVYSIIIIINYFIFSFIALFNL